MIRNIPSHNITEGDLLALFKECEGKWREEREDEPMKRLTKGVKIVRAKKNERAAEGLDKNLGYAFAEFFDEEFAKYCVRYWNNKQAKAEVMRKLILDFALEDARIVRKKEDKRAKRAQESKDRKKERKDKQKEEEE